jgi:hypothetical protein
MYRIAQKKFAQAEKHALIFYSEMKPVFGIWICPDLKLFGLNDPDPK